MNKQQVFSIKNEQQFNDTALNIFRRQAENCIIYKEFIAGLNIEPDKIKTVNDIPFLPIEFFKSHAIISSPDRVELIFTSSGTTGVTTSSHFVTDVSWYNE